MPPGAGKELEGPPAEQERVGALVGLGDQRPGLVLSAHKTPVVHRWLLAHARFVLHFTPTYSSWINQAGRWFAELQRRCLERGVFCSLDDLATALEDWTRLWNEGARPFTWTKTADQIIDRICRYCSRISEPDH